MFDEVVLQVVNGSTWPLLFASRNFPHFQVDPNPSLPGKGLGVLARIGLVLPNADALRDQLLCAEWSLPEESLQHVSSTRTFSPTWMARQNSRLFP